MTRFHAHGVYGMIGAPLRWIRRSFKGLSSAQRIVVAVLSVIGAGALVTWGGVLYVHATVVIPANGGVYSEGFVGQPQQINPILTDPKSDGIDRAIATLVYVGLMRTAPDGSLENALAEDISLSEDRRSYTITLKPHLVWHDGVPLTADDVMFTIARIQDAAYRSPLRPNWADVSLEKRDDRQFVITVPKPYGGFAQNFTVGILPRHLWEPIGAEQFLRTDLNAKPVGAGPYKVTDTVIGADGIVTKITLKKFREFVLGEPRIDQYDLLFYSDYAAARTALTARRIMALAGDSESEASVNDDMHLMTLQTSRVFGVFFNQTRSKPLSYEPVRRALSLATDRQAVAHAVGVTAQASASPFVNGMVGYRDEYHNSERNLDAARKILDDEKWASGDDGVRSFNGTPLAFTLIFPEWEEEFHAAATVFAAQAREAGFTVTLSPLGIEQLRRAIQTREYEALLFGHSMAFDPDPYSLWHSSQKKYPGLNFALFDEKNADTLLDEGRTEFDQSARDEKFAQFQKVLAEKNPAIILYSQQYPFIVSSKVGGIEATKIVSAADRYSAVERWYVRTRRVFP